MNAQKRIEQHLGELTMANLVLSSQVEELRAELEEAKKQIEQLKREREQH